MFDFNMTILKPLYQLNKFRLVMLAMFWRLVNRVKERDRDGGLPLHIVLLYLI